MCRRVLYNMRLNVQVTCYVHVQSHVVHIIDDHQGIIVSKNLVLQYYHHLDPNVVFINNVVITTFMNVTITRVHACTRELELHE